MSVSNSITLKAHAKLNLYLDILGKRADNYHEIRSVMQLIDLADDVTVSVCDNGDNNQNCVKITCSDPDIPLDNRNTAYKAAKLFCQKMGQKIGISPQIDIKITKKIPVMAGLGGSSADAAAVLRGLNLLYDKPFSPRELLILGAQIGADVPFCIHGGRALCKGTGAEIAEVLPLEPCAYVIVKPEFVCSTSEAYALYAERSLPPKNPPEYYYNVFEKLYNNPEIDKIKAELMNVGANYACLTGSGSAVFGVFDSLESAKNAFNKLNFTEKFTALPKRLEN